MRYTSSDPEIVMEEELKSFRHQQTTADGEQWDYTKVLISHLPQLYNRSQK